MNWVSFIGIFIIGTIFGSFCNVLVDRTKAGESLLGWSHCDFCGYKLRWYDNVPIISFLTIRGRCRKCRKKLSWQYPIVELMMGLVFLLIAWHFIGSSYGLTYQMVPTQMTDSALALGFNTFGLTYYSLIDLVFYLAVGFIFVAIFVWDYKYMIIPDELVVSGVILSLLYLLIGYLSGAGCFFNDYSCNPIYNILAGLIISGFFYAMFFYSKGRWIGGGDVKLGFWLGLLVGFKNVYFLLLIAYVLGSLVAIFLLIQKRKKMKSQLPFGPFLLISALVLILWQEEIWMIWNQLVY